MVLLEELARGLDEAGDGAALAAGQGSPDMQLDVGAGV
jgi:hypothetical protein